MSKPLRSTTQETSFRPKQHICSCTFETFPLKFSDKFMWLYIIPSSVCFPPTTVYYLVNPCPLLAVQCPRDTLKRTSTRVSPKMRSQMEGTIPSRLDQRHPTCPLPICPRPLIGSPHHPMHHLHHLLMVSKMVSKTAYFQIVKFNAYESVTKVHYEYRNEPQSACHNESCYSCVISVASETK